MLDLGQHGNGKRIARSRSSVLSRSRLISFLLVLLVCVPLAILLLLLVVVHVRALLKRHPGGPQDELKRPQIRSQKGLLIRVLVF